MSRTTLPLKIPAHRAAEFAPMSTTEDPRIALKYSRSATAGVLIFMLRSHSFMQQGADLVSAPLVLYLLARGD